MASRNKSGRTRLQIIRALAHGDGKRKMVVNCLFDTRAERSFVREDVAQEFSLPGGLVRRLNRVAATVITK
ncbi:hypothetical protein T12_15646 [Trichinella patagoniensis]|uniref:Uncharacterized protein n=1 Tax=Trichinella patagoniensis TaxID=990121 RepID=A0A0V0ZLM2_9BILA|nr:hypothetical protein T12_15646 [Trichinella patagoniensis]